ncbi:hypothetical protein PR048_012154 [Dryococelus australis]|uniref:Uncharacterized protein n=1 Tax=Dryococelus australis TaxID=614101 RepID=A0ABQ9HNN3_9NEOP|nr:hypothetical protein PR048_012154 [Dryococelus australis]
MYLPIANTRHSGCVLQCNRTEQDNEFCLRRQLMNKCLLLKSLMRVTEVRMEQHRNASAWETGYPRENPPTSGIVRHDSHMQKSMSDPAGD